MSKANSMPNKLIIGNWKMNTSLADAIVLASGVRDQAEHMEKVEIVLCPPCIWLTELVHLGISPRTLPHLKLGAQNMHFEDRGAFTGEISPIMVKEVAEYVILGHSERTHILKENPELISNKLQSALDHGLTPILCLGEDRHGQEGWQRHLVQTLNYLIRGLSPEELRKMVLAYEPVWAIGSGNPARPDYVQEVVEALRSVLDPETRVLYGGSVDEKNARSYLELPNIDGLLVGGASIKLKTFLTICQIADDLSFK